MTPTQDMSRRFDAPPEKGRKELMLLLFLLVYGYCFITYLPIAFAGMDLALFALSGLGAYIWYLYARGKKLNRRALFLLAPPVLLALSFAFFENTGIKPPLVLALLLAAAVFALNDASPRGFVNAMLLWCAKPFQFIRQKAGMLFTFRGKRGYEGQIVVGVVLALVITPFLIVLLSGADAVFSRALDTAAKFITENLEEQLVRVFFGGLLGCFIFSLFMSAAWETGDNAKPLAHAFLPPVTSGIVLGAANLVYIVFLFVQLAAFMRGGKDAYLAAFTAREGFFDMCVVVLINLGLLAVTASAGKTPFLRLMMTLLCVFTEALIALSIAKMALYINSFGLTLLRVQTTWFMLSLALMFLLILVWLWKRFPLFKSLALLCAASIIAASYANIGGMVAQGNVDRYLSGSLAEFDLKQYTAFPYEAAPALIRLYEQTNDAFLHEKLWEMLKYPSGEEGELLQKTVQRLMAEKDMARFVQNNRKPK